MNVKENNEPLPSFTIMEKRILRLVADGLNDGEISEELFIAVQSVKIRRGDILKKSGYKNITALIDQCVQQGVI